MLVILIIIVRWLAYTILLLWILTHTQRFAKGAQELHASDAQELFVAAQNDALQNNPIKSWGTENKRWNLFISRFFECPFCFEDNLKRQDEVEECHTSYLEHYEFAFCRFHRSILAPVTAMFLYTFTTNEYGNGRLQGLLHSPSTGFKGCVELHLICTHCTYSSWIPCWQDNVARIGVFMRGTYAMTVCRLQLIEQGQALMLHASMQHSRQP